MIMILNYARFSVSYETKKNNQTTEIEEYIDSTVFKTRYILP